ncbi:MAG: HAMP domain-containing histidine kinase [Ruminococcaceae bacterium]|nr:HAMP domain-containing histidine kinase [Oscillospiraceae bacterium]
MSEKLQKRLVRTSFLAVFIVLAVILLGMAIANYSQIISNSDTMLKNFWNNKSFFRYVDKDEISNSEKTHSYFLFFSVIVDEQTGELLQATPNMSAEFAEKAERMAKLAILDEDKRDFVEGYRYLKNSESEDTVCIIFLDCSEKLVEFRNFLFLAGLLGTIAVSVAVFIILKSYHRVLTTMEENNQKYRRYLLDSGHEFKTPIAIILADVDVLDMELENNEWVRDIRKQAKRLDNLTSDLGLLAMMENANEPVQMIDIPVSDVIAEAASSFQMAAARHLIDLNLRIQPMICMRGNDKNISQLVAVLLDNALKYAPEESEIVLLLEQTGTSIHLSVTNRTSFLIPEESLGMLFDRFYRIQIPEDNPPKGTGIGLSIAKAIVNAHKGKIVALSPEEKVFKIDITFPL